MKFLAIGDIHGRTVWKEADTNAYDRVIFLGDYVDSPIFDDDIIYNNLNDLIKVKQQQPDKITLLIGNHDAHYLHYPHYRCSGFREWAQPGLSALFDKHRTLFQIAYQHGSHILTHAGITNKWLARLLAKIGHVGDTFTPNHNLAELINYIHQQSVATQSVLFDVGPKRGGHHPFGGPVWADRSETSVDYLTGYHQIVGHTPTDTFRTVGNELGSITYVDILQTKTAFYEFVIPD
jgi:predicted phosphodiesterase